MQMYRVKFAKKLSNDMVDIGDVLVCAQTSELACEGVARILELPRSETQMEVERVKPSFYQISRREVKGSVSTFDADAISASLASSATFPGVTEARRDELWYSVAAQANIRAEDENEAISKLARSIVREMSGEKQKPSCKELDIRCDRAELHSRSPAIEQNALYTFRRIFQGGDART